MSWNLILWLLKYDGHIYDIEIYLNLLDLKIFKMDFNTTFHFKEYISCSHLLINHSLAILFNLMQNLLHE